MSYDFHSWKRNPFNGPLPLSPPINPPNSLTCPNPTGMTNIPGQNWGGQGRFPVLRCPAHPGADLDGPVVLNVYDGIPGTDFPVGNPLANVPAAVECSDVNPSVNNPPCLATLLGIGPEAYVLGRTDYVAVIGAFTDITNDWPAARASKYHSLFHWNAYGSLSRVPDGTSNTLLFAEYAGQFRLPPSAGYVGGWARPSWAANGVSAQFGTCPDPNNSNCDYSPAAGVPGGGDALGAWHLGIFQAAFADGSVRRLKLGLDKSLLLALAGFNDGESTSGADY
jgi:hypothetical protein